MSLEYRLVMSTKDRAKCLDFEVRARPEKPWRLFGFVQQHYAGKASEPVFTLSVHELVSREVHEGVVVANLETGLNMLLAMWQAHVLKLEASKEKLG